MATTQVTFYIKKYVALPYVVLRKRSRKGLWDGFFQIFLALNKVYTEVKRPIPKLLLN